MDTNSKLKLIFARVILLSGVVFLVLFSFKCFTPKDQELKNNVEASSVPQNTLAHVIVYHSVRPIYEGMPEDVHLFTVSPEVFESQIKYLHDGGYNVVPLSDLVLASEGKMILPSKPVAITFDDGWENQYVYAFPVLKKYNATATFFIFSNAMGHTKWMTWDMVREMQNAGMTIGSHTKTHPYLKQITDKVKLDEEIAGSKKIIEAQIGREVSLFAYPFGEYTEELGAIVKSAGYKMGRKFKGGAHKIGDDLFAVKAIGVTDDLEQFKIILEK